MKVPVELVKLEFLCDCGKSAESTPVGLATCGTPQCPDCDTDMHLQDKASISGEIRDKVFIGIGETLTDALRLPMKRNGRVDTSWGDKTMLGLGRTVWRMVGEEFAK